jgi:hypothetical protein
MASSASDNNHKGSRKHSQIQIENWRPQKLKLTKEACDHVNGQIAFERLPFMRK